jgi:hypothetical protein
MLIMEISHVSIVFVVHVHGMLITIFRPMKRISRFVHVRVIIRMAIIVDRYRWQRIEIEHHPSFMSVH